MRLRQAPYSLLVLSMLGFAACETEPEPESEPAMETQVATPAPDTAAMATPTAPADATGGTALTVAQAPDLGEYIADANGRALYLLEGEPQGESTCYDACAEEWLPFLAPQGIPTAEAPALDEGRIGTLQRTDGSTQVTYDGHALYYYHDDQGAGQTTGQDVTDQWGEWYLVQPSGEPLEEGGTGQNGV